MNLRGLRWQLAALGVSMLLFALVAGLRIVNTFQPSVTPTATSMAAVATNTPTQS